MQQSVYGQFPSTRLRRNRQTFWQRAMVREHHLRADQLIWPVFVQEGSNQRTPIASMPGVERLSIDLLIKACTHAHQMGISAVALFPVVDSTRKSEQAEEAFNPDNLAGRAVQALKHALPDLGIICDVALDPYTSHGHDGLLENGVIHNDKTLEALAKQALALAKAGADILAPSDMMDGRIGHLRTTLDAAGYSSISLLSYAAKYASCFYGPFRDAVGSGSQLQGASKATYQMDPANSREALREVSMDIAEGADMVMIKPGMPFLDIIARVHDAFNVPVLAYQVSGEYAMLEAAAQAGHLHRERAVMESLTAFKRAGACAIFTYYAYEVAQWLASSR